MEAAYVDVVGVDVSVLRRVGWCEAVSRCILSHVVIPVDDLAEALRLEISASNRVRMSGPWDKG